MKALLLALSMPVAALTLASPPAIAAYYWGNSVQSATPSVCFVGDALALRPDRVSQILDYISEFETAANIVFDYLGTCPDSSTAPGQPDFFDGEIRVWIPNSGVPYSTGQVPGEGCTHSVSSSGSWARPPDELEEGRSCLFNLKLGDDADPQGVPWRNHTLHEFGHALGLAHEHDRPDAVDASCQPLGGSCSLPANPEDSLLCMTAYDRDSVMHYRRQACGIDGNYGQSGLSALDKAGLQVLYPETARVAAIAGRKVVAGSELFGLRSLWELRGIDMAMVATDFEWRVWNTTYATSPTFAAYVYQGQYDLTFEFTDFLGRAYTHTTSIKRLSTSDFARSIAAPVAILSSLLDAPPPPPPPRGCGLVGLEILAGLALAHRMRRIVR